MSKKAAAAVLTVLITTSAVIAAIRYNKQSADRGEISFGGFYFDTAVTVKAVSSDSVLEDRLRQIIRETSEELSAYDAAASVYRLNRGEEYSAEKYPHVKNVLEGYARFEENFGRGVTPFCGSLTSLWAVNSESPAVPREADIAAALERVRNASDYNGDIPKNTLIDLGSGGKGYVCDLALEAAAGSADTDELIFSCSSSALLYSKSGRGFKTRIVDPTFTNELTVSTENAFISTGGGYERYFEYDGEIYSHIMDIQTGYPVKTDIASVTVILPCEIGNGIVSDLLATLLFIGGSEHLGEYAEKCALLYPSFGIAAITEEGGVITYGEVRFAVQDGDAP